MRSQELSDTVALLREQIARLERRHGAGDEAVSFATGVDALDGHLGGGLLCGAVHEFQSSGADRQTAARATRLVASILARQRGQVVWISGGPPDLNGDALRATGFCPGRLIVVETNHGDVAGLCEDVLRERGVAAVVAELHAPLSLTASRRLQLAAEAGGVTGFLLHRAAFGRTAQTLPASACQTRWRVHAAPGVSRTVPFLCTPLVGPARWRLDLLRQRGGRAGSWLLEISDDAPHSLRLAPALAHGSVATPASRNLDPVWSGALCA